MTLAIMQPYFMPYIGYFQLMHAAHKFVIYDDVSYIKQGWINRNRILQGKQPSYITVPLLGASSNKKIKECEIQSNKWMDKMLRTLQQSYARAPYVKQIFPVIETAVREANQDNISSFNFDILHAFRILLDIDCELIPTSSIYKNDNLSGPSRVIDICKQCSASKYINPIGGVDLYNAEIFKSHNIKLSFLQSQPLHYKQGKHETVEFLSIIDVLMFNGVEQTKQYLDCFRLV